MANMLIEHDSFSAMPTEPFTTQLTQLLVILLHYSLLELSHYACYIAKPVNIVSIHYAMPCMFMNVLECSLIL